MTLLTPEDVRKKEFTFHYLKGGYDQDEVDEFLEEIEETIAALAAIVTDPRNRIFTKQWKEQK